MQESSQNKTYIFSPAHGRISWMGQEKVQSWGVVGLQLCEHAVLVIEWKQILSCMWLWLNIESGAAHATDADISVCCCKCCVCQVRARHFWFWVLTLQKLNVFLSKYTLVSQHCCCMGKTFISTIRTGSSALRNQGQEPGSLEGDCVSA